MFEQIALRGESADLVFVYHKAAALAGWQIVRVRDSTEWKLTATVTTRNDYLTRQRPLLFTAISNKVPLRWEVQELHINERHLTATLGKPL